ncbi:MAG: PTS fructose transporter subunit IIA [Bulleidia sp.]
MIGIVVTGHGSFATGLTSSVRLIAGEPTQYETVDFLPEDSVETLTEKLREAFSQLASCKEGILVFTDLTGGSPFKAAAELSMQAGEQKIVVLSGTNLGMLIEANMMRQFTEDDVVTFADHMVETGRSLPMRFEFKEPTHEESADGEGI